MPERTPHNGPLTLFIRRLRGHQSYNKRQHGGESPYSRPEERKGWGYLTAKCICGASFYAPDDPFGIWDFVDWEKGHERPAR